MIHFSKIPNDEEKFRQLKFRRKTWKHRDFPTDKVCTLRFIEWSKKFRTGNVLEVNFCYVREGTEWRLDQTVCELVNGSYGVPMVINDFDMLGRVIGVLANHTAPHP